MSVKRLWNRCKGRYERAAAATFARRPFTMRNQRPMISFTFDDFPRSALLTGGRFLEEYGAAGTYYTSLGLMGKTAPTGEMFTRDDISLVLQRGHEFGCHTFNHCHAGHTPTGIFEASINENRRALRMLAPDAEFKTLSYPIGSPRPGTKKLSAQHFLGCRAGGQTFNAGNVDLNCLLAFFIEQSRDCPEAIKAMIDAMVTANGWLIFATHDVCESPTRYGCTPELFRSIVKLSVQSGARVLAVSEALREIGVSDRG